MDGRRLYVFTYDISDDRRRRGVARLLEDRGVRVQESVFEVRDRHDAIVRLAARIKRRMMPPDSLRVYPVPGSVLRWCITHGGAPVSENGDYYLF
jgi:CRISPR-associated protein Cas2